MQFFNASHLRNQGAVQTYSAWQREGLMFLNPLEIRDEEGSSKVPLCPDARENLGFSVQTIIASLTEFTKMQILLRD